MFVNQLLVLMELAVEIRGKFTIQH